MKKIDISTKITMGCCIVMMVLAMCMIIEYILRTMLGWIILVGTMVVFGYIVAGFARNDKKRAARQ